MFDALIFWYELGASSLAKGAPEMGNLGLLEAAEVKRITSPSLVILLKVRDHIYSRCLYGVIGQRLNAAYAGVRLGES